MITSPIDKVNNVIREIMLTLRSLTLVCWQPGWDTIIALSTILYMIPSYYLMANNLHQIGIFNFLFVELFVLVLLPAYYILKVRRESLNQIGITKQHWLSSLLISFVFFLSFIPRLVGLLSSIPRELILSTVIFNGLCLWEPFFVHCWVQLRFERAFGVIPSILAAGLCLASYHIGTYPYEMVFKLGVVGLMYGVVFRLTRNLLILWPLTWMGASTVGTVSGGYSFGWKPVWVNAIIVLLQGLVIWWFARTKKNLKAPKQNGVNPSEKSLARKMSWKDWLLSCIYGGFIIVQVALTFFNYNHLGLDLIANVGWLVLVLSAIFGWMPIFTLKKKGGVSRGKSYVHTTVLVDSGVYSIVRHPQYLAGVLMSLAFTLISQYWLNAILFLPVAVGFYWDSLRADEILVEKFGDEYKRYMKKVPRMNIFLGIIRRFKRIE